MWTVIVFILMVGGAGLLTYLALDAAHHARKTRN